MGLLQEIHDILDSVEKNERCSAIVLQGEGNIFCSGLDFNELIAWNFEKEKIRVWAELYMNLLRRFTMISSVIITKLDGKVLAGGTGFAAASDYVIATPNSDFKLTEALWGLIPAMVAPYLIRRIGFQNAYQLSLSSKTIKAHEAAALKLVDEVAENPHNVVLSLLERFNRLKKKNIGELKSYFRKMWVIDEKTEQTAIDEIVFLLQDAETQTKIRNYVEKGIVPWKQS